MSAIHAFEDPDDPRNGPASEDFVAAVDAAEAASYITCETCGGPGEVRDDGWLRVLCDAHEEERQAKR